MEIKTTTIRRLIVITLIVFVISFSYAYIKTFVKGESPDTRQDVINNCKNLHVIQTAECLGKEIRTFFYYNKTSVPQTFEEYKLYGGVCSDWAKLYKSLSLELGYESKIVTTQNHAFAIISDGLNGCILDMERVNCGEDVSKVISDYIRKYPNASYYTAQELRDSEYYRKLLMEESTKMQKESMRND